MAKFVSAQFRRGPRGGAQIVGTGSLREMHRVRSVEENWTSGTGLGFDITRIKDRTYVGHGGGYPGNTTQTLIQLDDKVGVIVLTNTHDSNPSDMARQLMATVGQAVIKASASKPATVAWDPTWARFAGLYRGRGGDSHVVLLNRRLAIITPNAPNVDNPVTVSWWRPAGRRGCTSATAGSIAYRSCERGRRVWMLHGSDARARSRSYCLDCCLVAARQAPSPRSRHTSSLRAP
jgi:hypothetical protein